MLIVDGSMGEGGGQVLRTSLALSLITRTPLRLERIRAGRKRPGLRAQHLACVEAAGAVGRAQVEGAQKDSRELTFRPTDLIAGDYAFDLKTAGSTSLVLQTILPALVRAGGPSRITLEGGTHNPLAPPFEFLTRAYLPLLAQMGPKVTATLERHGFYPKGGGKALYAVTPARKLEPLELLERGEVIARRAEVILSQLPEHIAERELKVVREEFGWPEDSLSVRMVPRPRGPGNALQLELQSEHVTELVTAFGEKRVSAEKVAHKAIEELRRYEASVVPVGEHLSDQLLLLLALAGAGRFRTHVLSGHLQTQIDLIPLFLPHIRIDVETLSQTCHELKVSRVG